MKIERIINGRKIEIELTESEMWDAFSEQEHEFDKEDVRSYMEERGEELTPEQIDEIAFTAREYMDGDDVMAQCRADCLHDAIKEALK